MYDHTDVVIPKRIDVHIQKCSVSQINTSKKTQLHIAGYREIIQSRIYFKRISTELDCQYHNIRI